MAVNVVAVPLQIVVDGVLMLTEGVRLGLTVILSVLEVAGAVHATELVITHVTALPLAKVDDVKVEELVPALTPFTFHW